ncbi:MAG: N-acetylmuramoyl-L-alanine amidase [Acetobacteraceae bacterium]|nr:N-acetylmuramoyl-L-alanine amidase [Acetobacteraceae bacterium]
MAYTLTWLAEVLEDAGLKVAEVAGWRVRGRGDVGSIKGVICHHTAGPAAGNMPSLGIVTNGRPDLNGPLAQLGLGRDGTFYVVAAGRANHAGAGDWQGFTAGNSNFIGIEAENTGLPGDVWPAVQMDAYARGVAAILTKIGASPSMCCGHKEYALPKGRKPDPSFDMHAFRTRIEAFMSGAAKPLLIPAEDDKDRPTLRRGARDPLVATIQQKLGIAPDDGIFGSATEAKIREFQLSRHAVPDGIVGPKTWAALDTLP